jgi:hypothetical protein
MPTAVRVNHQKVHRVAAHVENAQSHSSNLAGTNSIRREVGGAIIGYRLFL